MARRTDEGSADSDRTGTDASGGVALGPVAETLLIPLYGRAEIVRRGERLLADPRAVELVEAIDYDFARFDGLPSLVGAAWRTAVFDHWVEAWLDRHPAGTVVEIGVGLNTRYERVAAGRGRWIELDLPEAMALRRRYFADDERRRSVAASVLDDDWLDLAADTGPGPWLFVAEAVLGFLDADEVHGVLDRIARRLPGSTVAFDSWGAWMRENQEEHDAMSRVSARVRWFCDDPADIAGPVRGFDLVESVRLTEAPLAVLERLPADVAAGLAALSTDPQVRSYRLNLATVGAA